MISRLVTSCSFFSDKVSIVREPGKLRLSNLAVKLNRIRGSSKTLADASFTLQSNLTYSSTRLLFLLFEETKLWKIGQAHAYPNIQVILTMMIFCNFRTLILMMQTPVTA